MWLDRLTGTGSRAERARPYVALLVLGAVLFLPLLGWYGLWDPHEVRVAEIAREMAHDKTLAVPQRYPGRPALLLAAISLGYRALGNSEMAGRLPVALLSMLALCACFYAGSGLLRRRAALFGALALCTMPVFFLGARQLNSAVAPILASSLAIGGLGRAAWPRRGDLAFGHLLIGLIGLLLGYSAAGFALGVAVPAVAVFVALLAASPATAVDGVDGTEGAGAGPGVDPEELAPASGLTLPRLAFGVIAIGAVGLVVYAWRRAMPGGVHAGYSWVLAGTPHEATHQVQATTVLKQLGFSAFPWGALAPLALARLFLPRSTKSGTATAPDAEPGATASDGRDAYGRYLLLAWALVTYLATTLHDATLTETTYGAFAAIALLAGAFLDDVWDASAPQAVAAILAASFAAIVAHDFFMSPEAFAGAHVLEGIKWPPISQPPIIILAAGLWWSALMALALVVPARASRLLPSRQSLLAGALGMSLLLSAISVYLIVPEISKHLSYKGLFVKYKSIVGTGESEIGKYHVPGTLSDYAQTSELSSLPQMFDFFAHPKRVFVITASDDLPAIDQYAKQRAADPAKRVDYYVIDDANSKFLMLSNQLGGDADKNPLRRFVIPIAQGLPKQPDKQINASFEGKVDLVGYDLPQELERGKPFKFTAYYKVNQPVGGAYKIFLHFDGPGTRFNGDHVPLDGKFATNYWVPGHYIVDEFMITPDRATQPSGTYTVYMGFWLGDQRLKVTAGTQDGENRVRVGVVRVK